MSNNEGLEKINEDPVVGEFLKDSDVTRRYQEFVDLCDINLQRLSFESKDLSLIVTYEATDEGHESQYKKQKVMTVDSLTNRIYSLRDEISPQNWLNAPNHKDLWMANGGHIPSLNNLRAFYQLDVDKQKKRIPLHWINEER